jgi:DNA-binding XRE family transcriptional regulator
MEQHDVGHAIRFAREMAGLKQAQLAQAIGVTRNAVSLWENGKNMPATDKLRRIADTLLVDFEWLMSGRGRGPGSGIVWTRPAPETGQNPGADDNVVPVVGYVGAGAQAHFYEDAQGPFDWVAAPEGSTVSTVGVEIRGTSLGPLFDRWTVFYDEVRNPVTADLIGQLCVVGLEDGRVLIKKLLRSATRGRFNLISQNDEPILDVPVKWAARVKTLTPR